MVVPIANLSAVVTGAMDAAMAMARDTLPAELTRDALVEATRASAAWLMHHLWTWLVIARAFVADNLPAGAAAIEASAGPWVRAATRLLHGLYRWLVTAAVEKLPDVAAQKLLGGAAAWFVGGHGGVAVYVALALVLLALAFLCGAICAFETSPKRYFATSRRVRKALRAGSTGLLPAVLLVAFLAYLVAKVLG